MRDYTKPCISENDSDHLILYARRTDVPSNENVKRIIKLLMDRSYKDMLLCKEIIKARKIPKDNLLNEKRKIKEKQMAI